MPENNNQNQEEKEILRWMAPAYRHMEKTTSWYLFMGTIVAIFVMYGLLTDGYTMSIAFIILAAVYYLFQRKTPPMLKVIISDIGIRYGNELYLYSEIKKFWIYYDPPELHAINLLVRKKVLKQLSIDFPAELPVAKIRNYLLTQIPEEEGRDESFTETLIRNLGL